MHTERLTLVALTLDHRRMPRRHGASLKVLEKLGMKRVGSAGGTLRFELHEGVRAVR